MKVLIAIFTAAFLLTACNQRELSELNKEVEKLRRQNEMIHRQAEEKNKFVEEYATTLNEVYDNLENIRKREGLISEYSRNIEKGKQSLKDKMNSDISAIDAYIHASKSKLAALQKRFKSVEMDSRAFEKTIEKLTRQLEEKEKFIAELKDQNLALNKKVAIVQKEMAQKDLIIEEQGEQLATAYYVIGTDEELEKKHIVEEKGGILGFGKTIVVSSNLENSYFTSTKIDTMARITIDSPTEDIEIVSAHDPESFDLVPVEKDKTLLEIKDPRAFWKMRYLVIVTGG